MSTVQAYWLVKMLQKILLEALASTFATIIQKISSCEWSGINSLKMLKIT